MIGTTINERYQIEKELGRGGMGTVYRALDTMLHRQVAVKFLSGAELGTEGRARLLSEARIVAQLDHPNIVSVHDAGEYQGSPFIVMQLVEGSTLRRRKPENLDEILDISRQICEALEHAHQNGVVHRDLKPENVAITEDGTVKLMDFGIAHSVASRMTSVGEIIGTVFYLAPEIALGKEFDSRADLYSLGVMLYELTTGELPFMHGDPLAVISQHIHASVVPPRAKNDKVPPRFDNLIMQLLEKSPDNRPASAAEVQGVLERGDLLDPEAEGLKELAVVRRIARGRFVGREQELIDATALWNKALAGEGQLLLVSGEPGIGKTRLIRELSTHAEVTGGRSMIGECESEGGAPYTPFAQIVRKSLRQGSENGFHLPEFVLADLFKLAPELKPYYPDVPPNPKLEPKAEQRRLFENVVAFCNALSEVAPLMLVIDDAHWADSSTLALLRYLAGRTRKQRILLVAAYREVELDEARPFHETLLELNRRRLGTRIKLKRFDERQTRDLLAAVFEEEITPEFLEGIFRETEGNPFFIEEVCKALVESGQVFYTEGGWDRLSMEEIEIPQSVRVAIQSRISKFPDEYQDTLNLAAVLGREFDFDTLAQASELDEDTLIEAMEAAEDAQLIEEISSEAGATFSFVHALIPSTLVEGVRTLRRRRLHKRAAKAIEITRPEDFEDLAHHYEEAGDESRARQYYSKAGERASGAFANLEAESYLRAALELGPSQNERAELLSRLAEVVARLGRYDEAIDIWTEAAKLYEDLDDIERVASCYARMARARWWAGDALGALQLCEEGLGKTEGSPPSAELAELIHEAARAHHFLGNSTDAEPLCDQALEMARKVSARRIEADALITLGILPHLSTEEAIAALEQAIEICQAEKLLAEESRAHNNLGVILSTYAADFRASREHYVKSGEIDRRLGDRTGELFTQNNAASSSITMGELSRARETIEYLERLLDEVEATSQAHGNFELLRAYEQHASGHLEQAAAVRREQYRQAVDSGSGYELLNRSFVLIVVLIDLEAYNEAESVARRAIEAADQFRAVRTIMRSFLTIVLARKGQASEARLTFDEAEALFAKRSRKWTGAILQVARAELLAAEHRWDEAFPAFAKAAELAEQAAARFPRLSWLQGWARAHLQRGEPEDLERARELLQEVAAEFEQMGAPEYAHRIQSKRKVIGS